MAKTELVNEVEWEKILSGELKEVAELIGIENTLKLLERFGKTHIYFTDKSLLELKKLYILAHCEEDMGAKDLARLLKVSERFVFQVISESRNKRGDDKLAANQLNVFEN